MGVWVKKLKLLASHLLIYQTRAKSRRWKAAAVRLSDRNNENIN